MGNTTTQGMSAVTPVKEVQIKGTVKMRLLQRKNQRSYIKEIRVYDVFSGDGRNVVEGQEIQGSPLEIADAIRESEVDAELYASDILDDTISRLEPALATKGVPYHLRVCSAAERFAEIRDYVCSSPKGHHAIVVVDPNGPGALPFEQMLDLAKRRAGQVDLLVNISETAMKRILACAVTKDKNWWADMPSFRDFLLRLFTYYREMWLRDAIAGDPQRWRFICFWGWTPPGGPWEKQHLYQIKTQEELESRLP